MKKKLDIKKLVLLNLPYVFAFYFVDKLAAVFRLAPGTEFIDKLTGGFANFGAGLDFLAGNQTRAPRWMRALALEWLWRAMTNPRRMLPRYAACFAILPGQIVAALKLR